jgi:putative FmdB family regulatory protein
MPTYEYACKSCGEHLEVVQSFKDDPLTTCPACGGTLRKVFGSIGIAFKGSGFYKTDSRSSSSKAPAKAESAAKTDSGAKTESAGKSDSSSGSGSTGGSSTASTSTSSSAAAAS